MVGKNLGFTENEYMSWHHVFLSETHKLLVMNHVILKFPSRNAKMIQSKVSL
jgi:hypothetical protein